MENQQQQKREPNKLETIMIFYTDVIIRSLIALVVSLIFVLLLKLSFNLGNVAVFILAFVLSILISPLFSKVKLGHYIVDKYVTFLEKTFMEKK